MLNVLLQVFAAYVIIDLITGIYHILTDKGWNPIHSQVELFQRHHRDSSMDSIDWRPSVVAIPLLILSIYAGSPFLIALSTLGIFAQVPHYWAHRRNNHILITWLQELRLIISREHHSDHHRDNFNKNFCVFSGWNNWWLNWVVKKLEGT
jgi:palmitoyl-[glycerolipid] 3-(E)-desaturase